MDMHHDMIRRQTYDSWLQNIATRKDNSWMGNGGDHGYPIDRAGGLQDVTREENQHILDASVLSIE